MVPTPNSSNNDRQPRITAQLLSVLAIMLEAPTADWYGLELAKRASLKSGTIYPLLARLEGFGWLASSEEEIDPAIAGRPPRRLYHLTAKGAPAARATVADWSDRLRVPSSRSPGSLPAPRPGVQTA